MAFKDLTANAQETLGQLFLFGPTWDGHIISKAGRNELFSEGLAVREDGWSFLTRQGVRMAVLAASEVKHWTDKRWYMKATCQ